MFKLLPETLFLTVNIIDRFLAVTPVTRDKLQLTGITAMLIASKYEEIYPPDVQDFVFIADNAYPKQAVFRMEELILITLNWNLSYPSSLHFLRRYSKAAESDYEVHTLGKFMIETALMDIGLIKYLPSEIAAAAVYVSRCMASSDVIWTPTLAHYTTYSCEQVLKVAQELNELLIKIRKSSLKAISEKYASTKNGQVSRASLVQL